MKISYFLYPIVLISIVLFSSQHPNDTDNYGNSCNVGINAIPDWYSNDGYVDADAFFNANEGDCLSSDYLFIFYGETGSIEILSQNDFRDEHGNIIIQDFNQYGCCTPNVNNGGGGGGGSWGGWTGSGAGFSSAPGNNNCGCDFTITYDSQGLATVTVNCNCTNSL